MRVLIGIVQNADDRNAGAADLSRHAAIEILGCHHGDPVAGGMGRKGGAEGNGENRRQPDKCFHLKALASLWARCNIITLHRQPVIARSDSDEAIQCSLAVIASGPGLLRLRSQ